MSAPAFVSILLFPIIAIDSHILDAESNLHQPKLERNNIVNKRVWMKNKFDDNSYEKATLGHFIFRANSLDVENILQNNFDAFNDDYMLEAPMVSSYVKRDRRSNNDIRNKRSEKSLKNCKGNQCKTLRQILENNSNSVRSKIINDLKPASVFNDYPYEVAILLNNNKKDYKGDPDLVQDVIINNSIEPITNNSPNTLEVLELNNSDSTTPKRSTKYDLESKVIKKFEYSEDINKTDNKIDGKHDRNVFENQDQVWHQSPPFDDVYKVVPNVPQKSRPVTERGLLKVISMLTRTFKKIMRQHSEIKNIYLRMRELSNDLTKNAAAIDQKFQEFDIKYEHLTKFNEDIKNFELKLAAKEEYFKTKDRELTTRLTEFENQQKKFLTQQRQFYNIQKLMLAHNENINMKQNLIAKTQSEISRRQNNFARILKKAKQMYLDNKNLVTSKINISTTQKTVDFKQDTITTPVTPIVENIKINLFSIPPAANKITNHDDLIMKEKNEQPIDDLVYKHYFNNTFIDNLMKNKILAGIIATPDYSPSSKAKTKRDDVTILLPINHSNTSVPLKDLNRNRRWINHHSKRKNRRNNRGKDDQVTIINATDEKVLGKKVNNKNVVSMDTPIPIKDIKKDPFITMAVNFCKELREGMNQQMIDWCVEKALRRLQYIDVALLTPQTATGQASIPMASWKSRGNVDQPSVEKINEKPSVANGDLSILSSMNKAKAIKTDIASTATPGNKITEQSPILMTSPSLMTTETMYTAPYTVQQETAVFFPDNDELESNLKQYDLKQDTEGNIYYDGSIHASKFDDDDSLFTDDFMPGLESNSRIEVDPLAFDVQAKRRAYVRQLNEKIRQQFG